MSIVGWPGGRAWASVRPMSDTNWAGNYTYRAGTLHRPSSVEQVRELVAGGELPSG